MHINFKHRITFELDFFVINKSANLTIGFQNLWIRKSNTKYQNYLFTTKSKFASSFTCDFNGGINSTIIINLRSFS